MNTIFSFANKIFVIQFIVWSVPLMYNVKYWLTYFIFNLLFVAETTVDNIHVSDEGENAPQISPTIKKAKKSLRKQTNTSPVLDIGKKQYSFFKQAIRSKN